MKCRNCSIISFTYFVILHFLCSQAYETSVADAQNIIDKNYYGVLFWAFEGGPYGNWDGVYQEGAGVNSGFNKFPH